MAGDSNVRHDDAHIRLERRCVERGVRLTHQRRIIARILSEADDHPDVEELYRRAMIGDGSLSIATVYRTVRLLEKNGVIDRHTFVGTRARYEASNDARRHHLVDIETGKAAAFEDDTLQETVQQAVTRLGFDLVSHHIVLFVHSRENQTESTKSLIEESNAEQ